MLFAYRSEQELAINIKKATSPDESAPKRKHVRSCIVYTWDHKSGQSFWAGLKVCVYIPRLVCLLVFRRPVIRPRCFRRGGLCTRALRYTERGENTPGSYMS